MKFIRRSQFCALIAEASFQKWLNDINPELYNEISIHLSKSPGCRANNSKMSWLLDKLKEIGKYDDILIFLTANYPVTIGETQMETPISSPFGECVILHKNPENSIFSHYNSSMLTFPHKLVLRGDPNKLEAAINKFLSDKINFDYIIIDNIGYIEYFKNKYRSEASKIKKEDREIYKYKHANPKV